MIPEGFVRQSRTRRQHVIRTAPEFLMDLSIGITVDIAKAKRMRSW